MSKQRLVNIESRSRLTRDEFSRVYKKLDRRKAAELIAPQLPTGKLSRTVSENIITPKSASIPDCLTCGVCCDLTLCVPVSPQDVTAPENFWEITAGDNFPEIVIEKFLRYRQKTGVCTSLKGIVKENVACEIYETRPTTCREFEAGSDRCHAFRRMYNLEKPLSEKELARAADKLQRESTAEKITSVSIIPEEIQTERHIMMRMPDNTFSSTVETAIETKCKVYVSLNNEPPFELYSYDPVEESWLQHQFFGLTVAEAQKLISENTTAWT